MSECRSACDPPCDDFMCTLACENGFKHNADNCPVCECHDPCEVNLYYHYCIILFFYDDHHHKYIHTKLLIIFVKY